MKFRDAIEAVRSRTDIVEIIGAHLTLKKAGRNHKGLCPFHGEKTPSFTVSSEKQLYHCFGCGEGGSVFDFVMKIRNLSFAEALDYLAARIGVVVDVDSDRTQVSEQESRLKSDLYEINQLAAEFFASTLSDAEEGNLGREYLQARGIQPEVIREYGLGLAPESWEALGKFFARKGVVMAKAVQLGLVAPREARPEQPLGYYDRYRNRIMFPIYGLAERGAKAGEGPKVIGFGGRLLPSSGEIKDEATAKYINSMQSPVFDKGRSFYLIERAVEPIRAKRRAIVVEGYMDAIAMHQAGFKESVATLGTAMTVSHGKVLSRFVERVVLLFDGDEAGRKAAFRTLGPVVLSGLEASVVLLPQGEDPDSFVRKFGAAELEQRIEQGVPLLKFCCQTVIGSGATKREMAGVLEEISKTLRQVPNRFQRELWLMEFAQLTGVTVSSEMPTTPSIAVLPQRPAAKPATAQVVADTFEEEVRLISLMWENEGIAQLLRTYEGPRLFEHEVLRDLQDDYMQSGGEGGVDVATIVGGIQNEGLKRKLQQALIEVEELTLETQEQTGRDLMRRILQKRFSAQKRDLHQRISQAQQSQDGSGVEQLMNELQKLLSSKNYDIAV